MRPERNCLIGIMIFLSLGCATCQVDGSGQDLDAQLYLPMNGADGSTAILNEGSGSHVFTASGNTQIDTSQFQFGGTSLQFDGTGDFADTPDHANFDLSGGIWTVDFWARFTQLVTDNCIFSQSTTVDTDYFLIYTSGTALGFAVVAGGAVAVSKSTGNLVVDRWYHFAIVENGNAYQVWVDGKKAASITYDSDRPANYTSVATIGTLHAIYSTSLYGKQYFVNSFLERKTDVENDLGIIAEYSGNIPSTRRDTIRTSPLAISI